MNWIPTKSRDCSAKSSFICLRGLRVMCRIVAEFENYIAISQST